MRVLLLHVGHVLVERVVVRVVEKSLLIWLVWRSRVGSFTFSFVVDVPRQFVVDQVLGEGSGNQRTLVPTMSQEALDFVIVTSLHVTLESAYKVRLMRFHRGRLPPLLRGSARPMIIGEGPSSAEVPWQVRHTLPSCGSIVRAVRAMGWRKSG